MSATLDRREVVASLLADRHDTLVVSGLGAPTWDVAAAGPADGDFGLWGGMGTAVMVGLGLALARPERRVLVLTGDGEMLMGLGSLATAASQRPSNLAVVVLDNEVYGETGSQATHTAGGTDIAAVASAVGFARTTVVTTPEGLHELRQLVFEDPGPALGVVKVDSTPAPLVTPERDGVAAKLRFRSHVLGE